MEADWEFEIGGDGPVIEAYWSGFVDLREHPERVLELSECGELPGLSEALIKLNKAESPVWTSKSDVFTPENVDPDEMAASAEDAEHTIACYVDLLLHGDQIWSSPSNAERDCKRLCTELREIPLRCCRVDVVVRKALLTNIDALGATVYLTACGSTLVDARAKLEECVAAFTDVMTSSG